MLESRLLAKATILVALVVHSNTIFANMCVDLRLKQSRLAEDVITQDFFNGRSLTPNHLAPTVIRQRCTLVESETLVRVEK